MGLEIVEGSYLKYVDIYGKVAQSFRATHLILVFSQSMESVDFIASKSSGRRLVALLNTVGQRLCTPLRTLNAEVRIFSVNKRT